VFIWRAVRQALDVMEIQDTLHRYSRAIDRDDWSLLRKVYTRDAIDEHGRYNGDIEGMIAWLKVEMPRYESSMHFLGQSLIAVHRPTAISETYAIAYHRLLPDENGKQVDRVLGLRYVDELRIEDGRWRISHRRCVYEWGRIDPVLPGSELVPDYVRGLRGQADTSYGVLGHL
jgi:hypothetical protein